MSQFVIAGGSHGIGLQLTKMLVQNGHHVNVLSRTSDQLAGLDGVQHFVCDFASDEVPPGAIPESIDGIAYCPGTINLRSFRSLKPDHFRQDFEINVMGAIKFIQACMPKMKPSSPEQSTSIVLFSTVAAGLGMPMHASVAVSKSALEGLTRTLAAELSPHIRINCIAPALTDTPLAERLLSSPEKREAMAAKYPLKRIGAVQDMANIALFLLTPQSGWMTGQVIGVDGGMSSVLS